MKTYCCWNCCGLRKDTDERDPICPNCGCVMDRPHYELASLLARSGLDVTLDSGDADDSVVQIASVGSLHSKEPALLSYATSETYVNLALTTPNLTALFVQPHNVPAGSLHFTPILSSDPQADFFAFHNYLIARTDFYFDSVDSVIRTNKIDHSSVGNIANSDVILESGVTIGPNVTILSRVFVDEHTRIGPGAVIGLDGARLIKRKDGTRFRALHAGGVRIGKGVEIRANTVIMRSVWDRPTVIEDGAFIGNLVNVGHNCHVGQDVTILPGAVLCGRARIEAGATIAPGAIISNGVVVGEGAHVTLGAVVTKNVAPNTRVSGNFAVPHKRLIEQVKQLSEGE